MSAFAALLAALLCFGGASAARTQETSESAATLFERSARFARDAAAATSAGEGEAARGAMLELAPLLQRGAELVQVPSGTLSTAPIFAPRSTVPAEALEKAARYLEHAGGACAAGDLHEARRALEDAHDALSSAEAHDGWITEPALVLAVLLAVLAALLRLGQHPRTRRFFAVLPVIAWAYFVPTLLSNTGVLPRDAGVYRAIKEVVLPACLVLLILAADLPAIARLGKPALLLFLSGSLGVVLGAVISFLALGWLLPNELRGEIWKGLAALAGSWIGGAANFLAIGTALDAEPSLLSRLVIVDVVVSYLWMAFLLSLAGRERELDARIGADRSALDDVRRRIENAPEARPRPAETRDLLALAAIALGVTALARAFAPSLQASFDLGRSTWVVVLVTTAAIALSFTPARRLEAAGASRLGTALLYLLVACIGVGASFSAFLEAPALLAIGFLWISIHAAVIWIVRRRLRAPLFFGAVGSMANIGGPASAPVVAAAFHPALAPVGALLAVLGMILGTYAGLLVGRILAALS